MKKVLLQFTWFAKIQKPGENLGGLYQPAPDLDVNEYGLIYIVGSLYDYLSKIHDPRKEKSKQ